MMGIVEEFERAQLKVKLEERWCGSLMYADDIVQVADSGDVAADYVGCGSSICERWRMKFNSRKSKIMVVGGKVE